MGRGDGRLKWGMRRWAGDFGGGGEGAERLCREIAMRRRKKEKSEQVVYAILVKL